MSSHTNLLIPNWLERVQEPLRTVYNASAQGTGLSWLLIVASYIASTVTKSMKHYLNTTPQTCIFINIAVKPPSTHNEIF